MSTIPVQTAMSRKIIRAFMQDGMYVCGIPESVGIRESLDSTYLYVGGVLIADKPVALDYPIHLTKHCPHIFVQMPTNKPDAVITRLISGLPNVYLEKDKHGFILNGDRWNGDRTQIGLEKHWMYYYAPELMATYKEPRPIYEQ